MPDKKFVALFDIHIGHDYRLGPNGWEKKPTHNPRLLKALTKFIGDFKPDLLILGGDQLNCGSISHWNDKCPIYKADDDLAEEYEIARKLIINDLAGGVSKKVWMTGNHEGNITKLTASMPQLRSLLDPVKYLGIGDDKSWEVVPQGKIYKLGKNNIIHGDTLPHSGYVAQKAMFTYFRNLRIGHNHTFQAYTYMSIDDEKDKRTAICIPACCDLSPAFMKNAPNRHLNGLLYGYVGASGNFHDIVVPIVNDVFMIDGKEYRK